jgi:hypothetical protein
MFTDQMGNTMSQRPGFAAPRSSNYQKRAFMMINRPLLGVIQTGKKTHQARLSTKENHHRPFVTAATALDC